MTREEAIAELSVLHERLSNPKDCEDGCYSWEDGWYVEAIDMAIEALSAEAIQGWIPCSERLPDVDVEVLTTTDWSDILIAWLGKDGTWETDEYILDNDEIIAWMPLPKPYTKGDNDEER